MTQSMPTIRVTTSYAQCVYDADRVVRDSQVLVVEAWRERAWRRVGTLHATEVLSVDRFVPGAGGDGAWLAEDVRCGVGLSSSATSIPAAPVTFRPVRFLLRRSRTGR